MAQALVVDKQGLARKLAHKPKSFVICEYLSSEFHDALCDLGARLARLALGNPEVFS